MSQMTKQEALAALDVVANDTLAVGDDAYVRLHAFLVALPDVPRAPDTRTADTERLDWLEAQAKELSALASVALIAVQYQSAREDERVPPISVRRHARIFDADTIRAAIDAARGARPTGETP